MFQIYSSIIRFLNLFEWILKEISSEINTYLSNNCIGITDCTGCIPLECTLSGVRYQVHTQTLNLDVSLRMNITIFFASLFSISYLLDSALNWVISCMYNFFCLLCDWLLSNNCMAFWTESYVAYGKSFKKNLNTFFSEICFYKSNCLFSGYSSFQGVTVISLL